MQQVNTIQEQTEHIERCLSRNVHAMLAVPNTGTYTIGLAPKHGFEIFSSIVDEKMRQIINELVHCERTEVGTVYECSTLGTVHNGALRLRLTEVTDQNDREFLIDQLLYQADLRYHLGDKRILCLEVGDRNNVLPGEPGYDVQFLQGVARIRERCAH